MTEEAKINTTEVKPQLAGIGGWLVLPAIGLVLGIIIAIISIVISFSMFSDVSRAGYGGLYTLEILVAFGFFIFLIYNATRFFGKKINAPFMMIAFMVANVAISGLLLVIDLSAGAEMFAVENGKGLLRGIISAAIWIPYFRVSKRVKATFINP